MSAPSDHTGEGLGPGDQPQRSPRSVAVLTRASRAARHSTYRKERSNSGRPVRSCTIVSAAGATPAEEAADDISSLQGDPDNTDDKADTLADDRAEATADGEAEATADGEAEATADHEADCTTDDKTDGTADAGDEESFEDADDVITAAEEPDNQEDDDDTTLLLAQNEGPSMPQEINSDETAENSHLKFDSDLSQSGNKFDSEQESAETDDMAGREDKKKVLELMSLNFNSSADVEKAKELICETLAAKEKKATTRKSKKRRLELLLEMEGSDAVGNKDSPKYSLLKTNPITQALKRVRKEPLQSPPTVTSPTSITTSLLSLASTSSTSPNATPKTSAPSLRSLKTLASSSSLTVPLIATPVPPSTPSAPTSSAAAVTSISTQPLQVATVPALKRVRRGNRRSASEKDSSEDTTSLSEASEAESNKPEEDGAVKKKAKIRTRKSMPLPESSSLDDIESESMNLITVSSTATNGSSVDISNTESNPSVLDPPVEESIHLVSGTRSGRAKGRSGRGRGKAVDLILFGNSSLVENKTPSASRMKARSRLSLPYITNTTTEREASPSSDDVELAVTAKARAMKARLDKMTKATEQLAKRASPIVRKKLDKIDKGTVTAAVSDGTNTTPKLNKKNKSVECSTIEKEDIADDSLKEDTEVADITLVKTNVRTQLKKTLKPGLERKTTVKLVRTPIKFLQKSTPKEDQPLETEEKSESVKSSEEIGDSGEEIKINKFRTRKSRLSALGDELKQDAQEEMMSTSSNRRSRSSTPVNTSAPATVSKQTATSTPAAFIPVPRAVVEARTITRKSISRENSVDSPVVPAASSGQQAQDVPLQLGEKPKEEEEEKEEVKEEDQKKEENDVSKIKDDIKASADNSARFVDEECAVKEPEAKVCVGEDVDSSLLTVSNAEEASEQPTGTAEDAGAKRTTTTSNKRKKRHFRGLKYSFSSKAEKRRRLAREARKAAVAADTPQEEVDSGEQSSVHNSQGTESIVSINLSPLDEAIGEETNVNVISCVEDKDNINSLNLVEKPKEEEVKESENSTVTVVPTAAQPVLLDVATGNTNASKPQEPISVSVQKETISKEAVDSGSTSIQSQKVPAAEVCLPTAPEVSNVQAPDTSIVEGFNEEVSQAVSAVGDDVPESKKGNDVLPKDVAALDNELTVSSTLDDKKTTSNIALRKRKRISTEMKDVVREIVADVALSMQNVDQSRVIDERGSIPESTKAEDASTATALTAPAEKCVGHSLVSTAAVCGDNKPVLPVLVTSTPVVRELLKVPTFVSRFRSPAVTVTTASVSPIAAMVAPPVPCDAAPPVGHINKLPEEVVTSVSCTEAMPASSTVSPILNKTEAPVVADAPAVAVSVSGNAVAGSSSNLGEFKLPEISTAIVGSSAQSSAVTVVSPVKQPSIDFLRSLSLIRTEDAESVREEAIKKAENRPKLYLQSLNAGATKKKKTVKLKRNNEVGRDSRRSDTDNENPYVFVASPPKPGPTVAPLRIRTNSAGECSSVSTDEIAAHQGEVDRRPMESFVMRTTRRKACTNGKRRHDATVLPNTTANAARPAVATRSTSLEEQREKLEESSSGSGDMRATEEKLLGYSSDSGLPSNSCVASHAATSNSTKDQNSVSSEPSTQIDAYSEPPIQTDYCPSNVSDIVSVATAAQDDSSTTPATTEAAAGGSDEPSCDLNSANDATSFAREDDKSETVTGSVIVEGGVRKSRRIGRLHVPPPLPQPLAIAAPQQQQHSQHHQQEDKENAHEEDVADPSLRAVLCKCRERLSPQAALPGGPIYCQAIDSFEGRMLGCCNVVKSNTYLRVSGKIPFLLLCDIHRQRLRRHNCCPGCGLFCTQGVFLECRFSHHRHYYHKLCGIPAPGNPSTNSPAVTDGSHAPGGGGGSGGILLCPHCGSTDPAAEVHLDIKLARKPVVYLEQHQERKAASGARMSLGKRNGDGSLTPSELSPEVGGGDGAGGPELELGDGRVVSAGKLAPSLDRDKLETAIVSVSGGKPPNIKCTPKSLYWASKHGDLEKVLQVLCGGVDPNSRVKETNNQTGLHVAATMGNVALAHVLVMAGAALDLTDSNLCTPLMIAVQKHHNNMVHYLVAAGAELQIKTNEGMTCLHLAAKLGNVTGCRHLLDSGRLSRHAINMQDEGGWTPLVWGSENRHIAVVKFLLERGCNPQLCDVEQNTALHWAALSGCTRICSMLLDRGCSLQSMNAYRDTPLHIAARQNHRDAVVLLLARGASLHCTNTKGQTPLDCALPDSEVYLQLTLNQKLREVMDGMKHRTNTVLSSDIAAGKEQVPIPCINGVDDETLPHGYLYIAENTEAANINIDRSINSLKWCQCTDGCNSGECGCAQLNFRCWYDPEGRLLPDFNYIDPPMIFECNRACGCNKLSCNNRVVQHGITAHLQLFRTTNKGWGARALKRILKGSYVCEYVGEIITDLEADQRQDDSYLFDLDNRDSETFCIDARNYGNVARFINHLCSPNLTPVKVFLDHQDLAFPRIALYANRDIEAEEELGFDYGEKFWMIKYKQFTCTCGLSSCRYSAATIHGTLERYHKRLLELGAGGQVEAPGQGENGPL